MILLATFDAEDAESKLPVLTALTRKFRKSSDVQLLPVAAACPSTASGADMYGLAADAWTIALRRTLSAYGDDDIPVAPRHHHLPFVDATGSFETQQYPDSVL